MLECSNHSYQILCFLYLKFDFIPQMYSLMKFYFDKLCDWAVKLTYSRFTTLKLMSFVLLFILMIPLQVSHCVGGFEKILKAGVEAAALKSSSVAQKVAEPAFGKKVGKVAGEIARDKTAEFGDKMSKATVDAWDNRAIYTPILGGVAFGSVEAHKFAHYPPNQTALDIGASLPPFSSSAAEITFSGVFSVFFVIVTCELFLKFAVVNFLLSCITRLLNIDTSFLNSTRGLIVQVVFFVSVITLLNDFCPLLSARLHVPGPHEFLLLQDLQTDLLQGANLFTLRKSSQFFVFSYAAISLAVTWFLKRLERKVKN